jgi:hypothetical protein
MEAARHPGKAQGIANVPRPWLISCMHAANLGWQLHASAKFAHLVKAIHDFVLRRCSSPYYSLGILLPPLKIKIRLLRIWAPLLSGYKCDKPIIE